MQLDRADSRSWPRIHARLFTLVIALLRTTIVCVLLLLLVFNGTIIENTSVLPLLIVLERICVLSPTDIAFMMTEVKLWAILFGFVHLACKTILVVLS